MCEHINVIANHCGAHVCLKTQSITYKSPAQKPAIYGHTKNQAIMMAKFLGCSRAASAFQVTWCRTKMCWNRGNFARDHAVLKLLLDADADIDGFLNMVNLAVR